MRVAALLAGFIFLAASLAAQPIGLAGGEIDTSVPSPLMTGSDAGAMAQVRPSAKGGGLERELILVQFEGPIQEDWLEDYRRAGFTPHHYYPDYGYLMSVERGRAGNGLQSRAARWAGRIPAGLKIRPGLRDRATASEAAGESVRVTILSIDDAAAKWLSERGHEVRTRWSEGNDWQVTRAEIPAALVNEVALMESVFHVEEQPEYQLYGERAVQTAAGSYGPGATAPSGPGYEAWLALHGLTGGSGRIAQVMDDGIDRGTATNGSGHPDLRGRMAGNYNATSDPGADGAAGHGTLNAGIIAGTAASGVKDSAAFLLGQGIAPASRLFNTKIFTNVGGFFDIGDDDLVDLAQMAYDAGARFSNNSWGAPTFGSYNADSAEYDALVRDSDPSVTGNQEMTFMFASGNEGPGPKSVGAPATAKNVISVGATENSDANGTDGCNTGPAGSNSIRDLASFSSRGPTNDGRLGVTLVSVGTHVHGPASTVAGYDGTGVCDRYWPVGQTLFARSTGTSHSTPLVTGAAMLVDEFFDSQLSVLGHDATPSPAMLKAALVNSAEDIAGGNDGNGGILQPIPNGNQGWGSLNLNNLFEQKNELFTLDQGVVLTGSGQNWETTITPVDPGEPLKITLAWTDTPAAPGAIKTLVNDLDLIVVGGSTFRGNVFSGGTSIPGGSPDRTNNLECVYIANPSGTYTVRVSAHNIGGDGVPNSGGALDQDFALFVSNGTDQSSAGKVRLTDDRYTCGGEASVLVSDADLIGAGTVGVTVTSTTGDSEPLVLTETGAATGFFVGGIPLRQGGAVANGELDVQHNSTITARYADANNGSGSPANVTDTALTDCLAPTVQGVSFSSIDTDRFKVTVNASESSHAEIRVGKSCGQTIVTQTSSQKTSHQVDIDGLDPCTTYYVQVELTDEVGNASGTGDCYTVATKKYVIASASNFDSGEGAWTHFASTGPDNWAIRTVPGPSGSSPAFTYEPGAAQVTNALLVSPSIAPADRMQFFHTFGIESGFDGAVLEISGDGGATWADAGSRIIEGAYTGTISSSFGNPLGGRPAWTGGALGAMTRVVVDLANISTPVRVRFRFAADSSVVSGGWRIDNVTFGDIESCGTVPTPTPTPTPTPSPTPVPLNAARHWSEYR